MDETGYNNPRERRGMLICYSREREESAALVASGLNYAKIGPLFIHRPQLF